MFKLTKHSNLTTVSEIPVGSAFLHEGEVYVRIKTPKEIGAKEVPLSLSLETWQMKQVPADTEVETVVVEAISRIAPHEQ